MPLFTVVAALAEVAALNGDSSMLATRMAAIKLRAANFFTLNTPFEFPR